MEAQVTGWVRGWPNEVKAIAYLTISFDNAIFPGYMMQPLTEQDIHTPASQRAKSRIRAVDFLDSLMKLGIVGITEEYRKANAVPNHFDAADMCQRAMQRANNVLQVRTVDNISYFTFRRQHTSELSVECRVQLPPETFLHRRYWEKLLKRH